MFFFPLETQALGVGWGLFSYFFFCAFLFRIDGGNMIFLLHFLSHSLITSVFSFMYWYHYYHWNIRSSWGKRRGKILVIDPLCYICLYPFLRNKCKNNANFKYLHALLISHQSWPRGLSYLIIKPFPHLPKNASHTYRLISRQSPLFPYCRAHYLKALSYHRSRNNREPQPSSKIRELWNAILYAYIHVTRY